MYYEFHYSYQRGGSSERGVGGGGEGRYTKYDDLFDHYDAPDNSKKNISDNIQ